jgi:hypothetical protein
MAKRPSRRNVENSDLSIPCVLEVERLALKLLSDEEDKKKELRELLERYAARYARENLSRT